MTMKTSATGVAAIRQREGCRLTAYRDSVGVLTIGVGHTGRASAPNVAVGMTISQAEADVILAGDLAPFETAVNGAIKKPMTQTQFDACMSLAFNIGASGFVGSTVVHKFNGGDPQGAADAFLMWEKPAELKNRRIAERAQFLSTSQPEMPVAVASAAPAAATRAPAPATTFAPPHIVPAAAPKGFWASLKAAFTGKAA